MPAWVTKLYVHLRMLRLGMNMVFMEKLELKFPATGPHINHINQAKADKTWLPAFEVDKTVTEGPWLIQI